jgi:hypothetical protein
MKNNKKSIVYCREETDEFYTQSEFVFSPLKDLGFSKTIIQKQISRQKDHFSNESIHPVVSNKDIHQDNVFVPSVTDNNEVHVGILFIQAEAGMKLLEKINERKKLLPEYSNDLYLYTMFLWIGNESVFLNSLIERGFKIETNSGTVPKNDFIMLRFKLVKNYTGFAKNAKDYERIEFFNAICQDELEIIQISNRLSFETSKGMDYWER